MLGIDCARCAVCFIEEVVPMSNRRKRLALCRGSSGILLHGRSEVGNVSKEVAIVMSFDHEVLLWRRNDVDVRPLNN